MHAAGSPEIPVLLRCLNCFKWNDHDAEVQQCFEVVDLSWWRHQAVCDGMRGVQHLLIVVLEG